MQTYVLLNIKNAFTFDLEEGAKTGEYLQSVSYQTQ